MLDNNCNTEVAQITPAPGFKCSACGKSVATSRGLKIHEAIHKRSVLPKPIGQYSCPKCTKTFNVGRALSQHCNKIHGLGGEELYSMLNQEVRKTCVSCDTLVKFINQDKGYPDMCPRCSRKKSYSTLSTWNKGLTKESDERMAKSAENMRKHYVDHGHHNTGKTKENDVNIASKSKKISKAIKEFYANGNDHWSKGLTSETSSVIARRTQSIKNAWKEKTYVLLDTTLERMRKSKLLTHDVIQERLLALNLQLTSTYVDTMTPSELLCFECHTTFVRKPGAVFNNNAKCPKCSPPWASKTSKWQQEVCDFVATIVDDVEINNRTAIDPLELDIYIPSRKFAIECNGLYWHSIGAGQFDSYHAERKRLLAEAVGIKLFTLFEDDWRDKRAIVESMIRHRLGSSPRKVHARDLHIVRAIRPIDVKNFIERCHLDGHVRASYSLMLVTKTGQIIGTCSLRWAKSGADKTTLEIARMCFELETHVVGGVSKLLAAAIKLATDVNVKKIMSYSDNRLGIGPYAIAGMTFDGLTIPRFWWTDGVTRVDRFTYRADKSKNMSEKQVAETAGVSRIYGCSNSRYVINLQA